MNTAKNSWVGLVMALSSLNMPSLPAIATQAQTSIPEIENRIARIAAKLREQEAQVSPSDSETPLEIAIGWANGSGNRGWVNTRRGGWGDGHRGGFANVNPWRNGWGDRGGFANVNPWRNGGGFSNFNPWSNGWGNGGRFSNFR